MIHQLQISSFAIYFTLPGTVNRKLYCWNNPISLFLPQLLGDFQKLLLIPIKKYYQKVLLWSPYFKALQRVDCNFTGNEFFYQYCLDFAKLLKDIFQGFW